MKTWLSGSQGQIILEFMVPLKGTALRLVGWSVKVFLQQEKKALLSDARSERADNCVDLGLDLAK